MTLWLGLFGYLVIVNLVTYAVWGMDKSAARTGRRRVPEATLLALCLLGGWPFGLLATRVFRHKTSKKAFIYKFYTVVGLQVALIVAIILVWRG